MTFVSILVKICRKYIIFMEIYVKKIYTHILYNYEIANFSDAERNEDFCVLQG